MGYKYKLKGARYLRKYTAEESTPVYAAASETQKMADLLCDVPWERAGSDGPAMFTYHNAERLEENVALRDLFDAAAFCADHTGGAHRVCGNAAFYLFKLPAAAQGKTLEKVKVRLFSDPYNELGARVAVHLLQTAELPTACATVREGAAYVSGAMPRGSETDSNGRTYRLEAAGDVTIEGSGGAAIGSTTAYLAVFVGMENYARARNEWVEGSSYIRNSVEIETTEEIAGWTAGASGEVDCAEAPEATNVILTGGASPTWLEPPKYLDAGDTDVAAPEDAAVNETFFTAQQTAQVVRTARTNTFVSALSGTLYANVNYHSDISVSVTAILTGQTVSSVSVAYAATYDAVGSGTIALTNSNGVWSGTFRTGNTANLGNYVDWTVLVNVATVQNADADYADVAVNITIGGEYWYWYQSNGRYEQYSASMQNLTYSQGPNFTNVRLYDSTSASSYYLMLKTANGAPVDADECSSSSEDSRQHKTYSSSVVTEGEEWTVTVGGTEYSVEYDSSTSKITLKKGTSVLAQWTTEYDPENALENFFDPCVALYWSADAAKYGVAAAMADFSSAVATFEGGTQPSDAELLGRLVRMSKAASGSMAYLHPKTAALARELDAMRPVPRFWRGEAETGALPCQPGLSAWFFRASSGTPSAPDPSTVAVGAGWANNEVKMESVVSDPAFLQLAMLALRAPCKLGVKLVLKNAGVSAVPNAFELRFVAWRSPAQIWDGANSFALSALASMPSLYRSDGSESASWQVDCSGAAFPFGTRNVTAERVGVSGVVSGDIAAAAEVEIPLGGTVDESDVILIAPEVVGFASGGAAPSAYFGRQADPAGSGAAGHNFAWARHEENLGWFPRVTGV